MVACQSTIALNFVAYMANLPRHIFIRFTEITEFANGNGKKSGGQGKSGKSQRKSRK